MTCSRTAVAFGDRLPGARHRAVDEIEANLREGLARFPDKIIEANVGALQVGLDYADEAGIIKRTWTLDSQDKSPHLLMTGQRSAGFRFCRRRRPVLHRLPHHAGHRRARFPQPLATEVRRCFDPGRGRVVRGVNMALGAAMTGVRTMTGSSGPGIALMQEGIGQAGAAEIPLVVVNSQRSGPSTGMPTKPEQSDIGMMVSGGNGDFPRVVLAPSDPSDAFEIGVLATNIAARIQTPVYVALDQAVGQNSVTVPPFDLSAVSIDDGRHDRAGGGGSPRRDEALPDHGVRYIAVVAAGYTGRDEPHHRKRAQRMGPRVHGGEQPQGHGGQAGPARSIR